MKDNYVSNCMMIAKGILRDMTLRRKMVTQLVIFMLILVGIGNWIIDDWLKDGVIRFVIFWGGVTFLVLFILLMAVYDLLKVMKSGEMDE